ncbi:MAG TPA: chorismate-binding protein, partial [Luteimonas sp.]|nr:chorismate-binding protein [Luteimonas sp.]
MIATRMIGDVDLLACQRRHRARYPLLLESVADGTARARWDLLLATDGRHIRLDRDGVTRDQDGAALAGDFLSCLDRAWSIERTSAAAADDAPFPGGWAVFLGYELAGQVEPVLALPAAAGSLPVALAVRCPAALLRDRADGRCLALAEADAATWLDTLQADAAASVSATPAARGWEPPESMDEEAPAVFAAGVRRILAYLVAGDVFQANLSRGWTARFREAPDAGVLYARLREANPAPFAGLFVSGEWAVASASPERLVSVRGSRVETRPIAGTRPRLPGDDDGVRIRELAAHPKERAEHVMLVDLERNDLGRVCVGGSVEVDEL